MSDLILQRGAAAADLLLERQKDDPLYLWEPMSPQREFLEAPESEVWYFGANRTGKSDVLAAGAGSMLRTGNLDPRPAYIGGGNYIFDRSVAIWVVSLNTEMGRTIIAPKIFNNGHVPPGQPHDPFIPEYEIADWNITESTLRLKNGSLCVFKSCDQGTKKFQGTGRDGVFFDEAPPKTIYNEAAVRVEAGRKLFIRGAATLLPPEGVVGGVSWLYAEKIRPYQQGKTTGLRLIGAKMYDNYHLCAGAHGRHEPHIGCEIARLESIYPVGSIDRRIRMNGEWLPQMVGNVAYGNFRREIHVNPKLDHKMLDFRLPILYGHDSNVYPSVAVIGQQHGRIYRIFDVIVLDEGGIPAVGREFVRLYPHHGAELLIYGDATATRRSAQTTQSDYDILLSELSHLPYPVTLMVPRTNPPVRDRLNSVNFLLRGAGGEVRIELAPHCEELIEDLETVLRDKHGGILKSHDKRDPYYRRTHTSDALGYLVWAREPIVVGGARESQRVARIPSPQYQFAS